MLKVGFRGLLLLIASPVEANTSFGMAAMPSDPIRIAWSFSSRVGGDSLSRTVSRA